MTVQHRDDTRTCTACQATAPGGYSYVVGDLTFSLCPRCTDLLRAGVSRAQRRAAREQAEHEEAIRRAEAGTP